MSARRRALLTGHFSTVGDVEVLREVEARLRNAEIPYEIAPYTLDLLSYDPRWVDAATLDPADFTHLVVICGPYAPDYPQKYPHVLVRFRDCTMIGVNLTMVAPVAECQPFDVLVERDSDRMVRPDLSFLQRPSHLAVVGLCLARSQREYGGRQMHDEAERRLRALLDRAGVAVVELDTSVPQSANRNGIANPEQFESILSRVDALVTTRLHGMVLALKNGIPVLAVDAIAGRDKVTRQAMLLDWAEIHALADTPDAELDAALARCLAPEALELAHDCAARARALLADWPGSLMTALDALPQPERRPQVASGKGRLSQLAARYRHWKRGRFPKRQRRGGTA